MERKVVVKVHIIMNGRCRCKSPPKALKIVAGVTGVEAFALKGEEKDQIEVIGEDIDAVVITKLLRKNFGFADLVAVGPVENPDAPPAPPIEVVASGRVWPSNVPIAPHFVTDVEYVNDPACCSIM